MTVSMTVSVPVSDSISVSEVRIRRALLSVTDKTGLEALCKSLLAHDCQLFATSSTAEAIRSYGLAVSSVEASTGFPEILGGRVKTLHPKIFGGILAQTHLEKDASDLKEHGITPFDVVVCNLYPFRATVEALKKDKSLSPKDVTVLVEKIDIGGVSLLRAAGKNFARVSVLSNPSQYPDFQKELETQKGCSGLVTRGKLAVEAFALTRDYDSLIAASLAESLGDVLGAEDEITLKLKKVQDLRYGENPHQRAFFASLQSSTVPFEATSKSTVETSATHAASASSGASADTALLCDLTRLKVLQGKELSYNNVLDLEHAIRLTHEFSDAPAAIIVKHNVACGVATSAKGVLEAYQKAFECDRVSPFGGVVSFNRAVSAALAKTLSETFLEVIVAPEFDAESLEIFSKKKNLRLVTLPVSAPQASQWTGSFVQGGLLIQECDTQCFSELKTVTQTALPESSDELVKFAFLCVKHLRSNAIVLAINSLEGGCQTVALAGGYTNRVDAARQALSKWAQWRLENPLQAQACCVLASDAFFPFPDSLELMAGQGIHAVVQPGGSVQDGAVIEAANRLGIPMAFTGMRHFKH